MKFTKAELTEKLQNGNYTVTFTKVDGEQRVMPCTLREGTFPLVESKGDRKINDATMSVWCTDNNAWRSFRVDSVTDIMEI